MALGTLALIGLGMSVAGTGMSALGQFTGARSEKAAQDYNAAVSEANAEAATKKAAYEEDISRTKLAHLMGQQRSLYAKAGVDISSGSPLLVLAETAAQGEKEAQAIKYGGEVEATQQLNQSQLQRFYGKQAMKAGYIGAGSTLFKGLGEAAVGYGKWKMGKTNA